jgi:hypothetical protein
MCCFSQPVERVSDTAIFARRTNGRQLLAYSMRYRASAALAMVLPLPVPPDPAEDAVTFINLERYPEFFADVRKGFPPMLSRSLFSFMGASVAVDTLEVHDVGSFEASFVPRVADFVRLDERFRIPASVWDELLQYGDYGFAVFKLKATSGRDGAPVHPMAFEFPQREADLLFFPTVHVHDRSVHAYAEFDHALYCQVNPEMLEHLLHWQRSRALASAFIDISRAKGVVDGDTHCWRRSLKGKLTNQDTWVGAGGSVPQAPT